MKLKRRNVFIRVTAFLAILFTMPLGHALMILMEHLMNPVTILKVGADNIPEPSG